MNSCVVFVFCLIYFDFFINFDFCSIYFVFCFFDKKKSDSFFGAHHQDWTFQMGSCTHGCKSNCVVEEGNQTTAKKYQL